MQRIQANVAPRDAEFFTGFITQASENAVAHSAQNAKLATLAGEPNFSGKYIGDLVAAQSRAMVETFARNHCPVRTIHVETLDEKSLGELLMHFMLETIIAARLLRVDPFDQPAVEEAKVLAKKYLTGV